MTLAVSSASAGTVGFLVVVLLGLATYLLLRSMNTRLRNVRRNAAAWPSPPAPTGPSSPAEPSLDAEPSGPADPQQPPRDG